MEIRKIVLLFLVSSFFIAYVVYHNHITVAPSFRPVTKRPNLGIQTNEDFPQKDPAHKPYIPDLQKPANLPSTESDLPHKVTTNNKDISDRQKRPRQVPTKDEYLQVEEAYVYSLPTSLIDVFDPKSDIPIVDNIRINSLNRTKNATENSCPSIPPKLRGRRVISNPTARVPDWRTTERENPLVKNGKYSPSTCEARYRVAIIIPFRDREEHLKTLMRNMHPILQRQQVEYTIYTISLAGIGSFNRAKLLNIGFVEANMDKTYDCYIFQDVDLLLENDKCLYWCTNESRQISCRINKFGYKPIRYDLMCPPSNGPEVNQHFGGVSLIPHNIFLDVNGFSNLYWGWGGEDDDMFLRLWSKGHIVGNSNSKSCTFYMIKHERESSNKENPARNALIKHSLARRSADGLNTLRYKRLAVERHTLYVNITVDIGGVSEKMKAFMKINFKDVPCKSIKMPWE